MATAVCLFGMTGTQMPVIEVYAILGLCAVYLHCDVSVRALGKCAAAREAAWEVTQFRAPATPSSMPNLGEEHLLPSD